MKTKIKTATIRHKCSICGRQIAVGEKYINSVGEIEGKFTVIRRCEKCGGISNG